MKKKYLTTPEEVLALKDTATKIYYGDDGCYIKFINGVLCFFSDNGVMINASAGMTGAEKFYILIEEPVEEADENDIGRLCKFWNDDVKDYVVGTLCKVHKRVAYPYCIGCCDCWYKYCCRLTPAEVAEITGYKVGE